MKRCPLCGSEIPDSTLMCDCGYDFEKEEVGDKTKVSSWINAPNIRWHEEVRRKKEAHKFLVEKHGEKITRSKDAPGWTQIKTAEIIGESPANLCRDLEIAEALDTYPELVNCKDKTEARRQLGVIKGGMPGGKVGSGFKSEDELQKYLVNNWEKTPLAGEWDIYNKYRNGKSYAGEVGEIDILAKHRKEPRWLVIELKKDQSTDGTVGQLLRYMGWVEFDHRANAKNDRVEGLIISKSTDRSILYAMYAIRFMSNISLQRYNLRNENLQLERVNIVHELLSV